jgi:hypothetical protein
MSYNARSRRRWGVAVLAATLALAVVAAPAVATGPLLDPVGCPTTAARAPMPDHVRAACERRWAARQTTGNRGGFDGSDAGIIAGGVALLVLMMAGGMLVATHRRDAQEGRPAAVSGAAREGG